LESVAPKTKKPDSEQLIGLSGLSCKHALAVFITRPQADHQIGALHKNNQVSSASQTNELASLVCFTSLRRLLTCLKQYPQKHGKTITICQTARQ
jgi:hypothetical protein